MQAGLLLPLWSNNDWVTCEEPVNECEVDEDHKVYRTKHCMTVWVNVV